MNEEQKRERIKIIFEDDIARACLDDEPLDFLKCILDEDSFLHIAARRGNMEAVEILVELGININALGDMNCTPLHCAAIWGHEDIYNYLIAHGADPTIKSQFGKTPLEEKERYKKQH